MSANMALGRYFFYQISHSTPRCGTMSRACNFSSKNDNDGVKLYAPPILQEVQPPVGGGPIYWSIRRFLMRTKRKLMLQSRERRYNWDFGRAAFAGCPKLSYDPKINQWITLMDNQEWGGIGGRFWIQISNTILFNIFLGFCIYVSWFRIVANNKHNVFARWANRDDL